ncbi:JmjC domain, hydroxylase-domain-containing protein [Lentinula lateritia]|uniref:[histone H3]-trimethyl-L-lysine(9) demethylase n=1 Tax=Lentinula lateritia TaxID=40482 RepID=A0ABQ8VVG9_9AGAR|nr:JmjC domain, hydroxylase-domain-containing protein [Lentinula lateritia]
MDFSSPTPSLTPSIGSPPFIPVQPDHFYRLDDSSGLPSSPRSLDGTTWYEPEDDRLASRGIPVFRPTMEEFRDFEAYMNMVECWGKYSGIVKVIPPKEWSDALPSVKEQLSSVQIKAPIEQLMLGQTGLFRQQNMEKRRTMSVREWAEFCSQPEYRAPSVDEVGIHARTTVKPKTRKTRKSKVTAKDEASDLDLANQVVIKEEPVDSLTHDHVLLSHSATPVADDIKPKVKNNRRQQAKLTEVQKLERDASFLDSFDPALDWLPFSMSPEDYTPEFCAKLERHYWRNLGLGKAPWYGADTQGSLFTHETEEWNVAHLESELSRLLPSSDRGLPGVNTPYLYWGMWRATFAWHVEDMDLFSINYIHFGAPKFWYAMPQGRAAALEQTMRSYFPKDTSQCPEFLRHKSFLASPTLLARSACRPNTVVQHAGEFIITYPRGYHAGFNLGLNCAESVNFALKSWVELGKVAKACKCVPDSVVIDVGQLIADRAREKETAETHPSDILPSSLRAKPYARKSPTRAPSILVKEQEIYVSIPPLAKNKRKATSSANHTPAAKRSRKSKPTTITLPPIASSHTVVTQPFPKLSIKLKLGPRPVPEVFPCCLCVSMSNEGLLHVHDPPFDRKEALEACSNPSVWMAHEQCANIIPETWVDAVEKVSGEREKMVFGVDGIVKDRWNLKCSACTRMQPKAHGAPIQCTRGKCLKAFHVSCACEGKDNNIVFNVLRESEKEVVLLDAVSPPNHKRVDVETHAVNGHDAMAPNKDPPSPNVLKVIKKLEVQVLCSQHNPAVAAAKRASKQDRIKADLLALPSMSRIKLRVSAGVFEVSLIRVIEEIGSVEVVWDRGSKREFKWGSVVFGNTDGPILQKPSEPAPDPPPMGASLTPYSTSSTPQVTASHLPPVEATSTSPSYSTTSQYPYAAYNLYDYGKYLPQPSHASHGAPNMGASSTNHVSGPSFTASYTHLAQSHYLQSAWQQQYQQLNLTQQYRPSAVYIAPQLSTQSGSLLSALNQTPSTSVSPTALNTPTPIPTPILTPSYNSISSSVNVMPNCIHPTPIRTTGSISNTIQTSAPTLPSPNMQDPPSVTLPHAQSSSIAYTPPQSHMTHETSTQAPVFDFDALKSLRPEQLVQLVRDNAQFRDIFQSAFQS